MAVVPAAGRLSQQATVGMGGFFEMFGNMDAIALWRGGLGTVREPGLRVGWGGAAAMTI